MREQKDLGLLILRGAGPLLALTFGVQKIGWYWSAFHAGKPFSSIGLAPLIAKMGFAIPVALALWITFNESIGAFLIGCGFLTRLLAASLALGMAGALYASVRLGEDWLRAALYLIIFIALTFTGAGKFPWIIFSSARNPKNWINDGGGSRFDPHCTRSPCHISSLSDARIVR